MKINLIEFREKLNKVTSGVGSDVVRMTVLSGSEDKGLVLSGVRNSFALFLTVRDITDAAPMNVEVNASLLKSIVGLFIPIETEQEKDNSMELVCKSTTILLKAYDNVLAIPYADLGVVDTLDDMRDTVYVKEFAVKFISQYINDTAHALESAETALCGSDIRRGSYHMEADDDLKNVRVTTTDFHRISIRSGALKNIRYQFVIPGIQFKAVVSMLKGDDDTALFRVPENGSFLQMIGKDIVAVLPLVNERIVDVNNILNKFKQDTITITANRRQLINACELSMSLDRNNKIILDADSRMLNLEANNGFGTIRKSIAISRTPQNKIPKKTAFSARFMLEALKSLRGEKVDLEFESSIGVCKIVSHVEDGDKPKPGMAAEVILPIKTAK